MASFLFLHPPCLSLRADEMTQCQDRVIKDHTRSREAHDLTDFVSHFRSIAVHLAVRAEGLCFHKRAFVRALAGIICQDGALRTKCLTNAVMLAAIQMDHQRHNLFFLLTLAIEFILFHLRHIPPLKETESSPPHPSINSNGIISAIFLNQ